MSDLLARLRIEADASSVPAAGARVERTMDGVRTSAQRAGASMAGSEAGANRMAAGLDRAGDQAQRFETRTRGAASSLGLLTGAFGGAAVSVFVSDITKAAFAAGGLESGLGAVTNGAAQAKSELAFVRREAADVGITAQAGAQQLMVLAAATNETALEGQKTRDIWLATAEAGFILGRTPEQIGRGLEALSQIAGKQVVSMEEVRQQLAEAIPGAAAISARAMGLSSAAFNELVESGKLTADEFLPKFAAELRETYGPAVDAYLTTPLGRARREMGVMGTSLNDLRAAGGEGFLAGAVSGLSDLNAELSDAETAQKAREIGEALGEGAAIAADGLIAVIDHLDEIVLAGQVVIGVGLVRFLVSTAQAAQQAAAAYIVKGAAARASAATGVAGATAEAGANAGLRAQLAAVAAAEVSKAEAGLLAAKAHLSVANATATEARQTLAATGAGVAYVDAKVALTRANGALIAAENGVATAAGRVAAAQGAAAASTTAMAGSMAAARGAGSALLGLVGGPWGAAFLAAGVAVWGVAKGLEAMDAETRQASAAQLELHRRTSELDEATGAYEVAVMQASTAQGEARRTALEEANALRVLAENKVRDAQASLAAASAELVYARARAQNFATAQRLTNAVGGRGDPGASGASGGAGLVQGGLNEAVIKSETVVKAETDRIEAEQKRLDDLTARLNRPATIDLGGGGGSGDKDGKSSRDRAADLLKDLAHEEAALKSHMAAVIRGEAALDAWRIAQAGADAVARAGSESVRERAEAVERLAIADERIEQAAAFSRSADNDVEALRRRAVAAREGEAALENLRITEAGLEQLTAARVTSLEQLSGPEREAVANAIASAEARERQAIATEKAEAAGKTVTELEEEIAAEVRRQATIGQGVLAEHAYARAEFIRQEIERAGLKVTDEAAEAIREKAAALFDLRTITDAAQADADQERELRLLRLSNREREIAVRAESQLVGLRATLLGLNEAELKAVAERRARTELEAEETAAAIGRITGSLRDGFIRDGKLGLDEISDYAEERLRAALYDAFLAEPINIVVSATVDIVNDLAKQIFGGADAKGFLTELLGSGGMKMLGNAGMGYAAGSAMGLGSGNGLLDAGLSIGGSFLGGMAGTVMTPMLTASLGAVLGPALAGVMGPIGALAGVALGTLLKDEKRPYTRADIVAQGGEFVVAGTQGADGGSKQVADELGKAITSSLNAAADLFKIDVTKLEGLYTTAGYVEGGNYKALGGEGYFGGDIRGAIDYYSQAGRDLKGNTLGAGVSFSQVGDAEKLAEQVVRETILRAIAAGASDLSDAEAALVQASSSLEEAIGLITTARGFGSQLDDMLLELLDPAAFEKKKALDAIEATYQALKTQAGQLIGAGLLTADTLDKIEQLRDLQIDQALNGNSGLGSTNPFVDARERLQSWLDGLAVSDYAPGGASTQRETALAQYQRVLAQAQSGDRTALADLATYADRLLKADRAATGSAAQRQALYDQVTRDVTALISRAQSEEPLTAGAITDPIIAALAGSNTALADVLLTLPPSTAAPLLEAILRQPDWAARLLGENVQVPPALADLAARVQASAPEVSGPIVAAVLSTPAWTAAMNAQLAQTPASLALLNEAMAGLPLGVTGPIIGALIQTPAWADSAVAYLQGLPPSLELLQGLTAGLPAATTGPIISALLQTPTWADAAVSYLGGLTPSLELLQGLTAGMPAATAGPIIAALAATPGWATTAVAYLQGLEPSLALLQSITSLLPAETSGPIVGALLQTPAWATTMLAQLSGLGLGVSDPIVQALLADPAWASALQAGLDVGLNGISNVIQALLDWLSQSGPEVGLDPDTGVQVPDVVLPDVVIPEITIPDIIVPDLVVTPPPSPGQGGAGGGGGAPIDAVVDRFVGALGGLEDSLRADALEAAQQRRDQLDALMDMLRESRLNTALQSMSLD